MDQAKEELASELARGGVGCNLVASKEQETLGIPPSLIYMAGLVLCQCRSSSSNSAKDRTMKTTMNITSKERTQFETLQNIFHQHSKGAATTSTRTETEMETKTTPPQHLHHQQQQKKIFHLSPRLLPTAEQQYLVDHDVKRKMNVLEQKANRMAEKLIQQQHKQQNIQHKQQQRKKMKDPKKKKHKKRVAAANKMKISKTEAEVSTPGHDSDGDNDNDGDSNDIIINADTLSVDRSEQDFGMTRGETSKEMKENEDGNLGMWIAVEKKKKDKSSGAKNTSTGSHDPNISGVESINSFKDDENGSTSGIEGKSSDDAHELDEDEEEQQHRASPIQSTRTRMNEKQISHSTVLNNFQNDEMQLGNDANEDARNQSTDTDVDADEGADRCRPSKSKPPAISSSPIGNAAMDDHNLNHMQNHPPPAQHNNKEIQTHSSSLNPSSSSSTPLSFPALIKPQEQILYLEAQLEQTRLQLKREREEHIQSMRRERERHDDQVQALQMRLYISETKCKNYEDALREHVLAVKGLGGVVSGDCSGK